MNEAIFLPSVKGLDDYDIVALGELMRISGCRRYHHSVNGSGYSGRRDGLLLKQSGKRRAVGSLDLLIIDFQFHNLIRMSLVVAGGRNDLPDRVHVPPLPPLRHAELQ